MALKGIDAQILVTNTAEASRESSRMAYRGELVQDYISVQARVEGESGRERVAKTIKSERLDLYPDDGGSGGAAGDGGGEPPEEYALPEDGQGWDERDYLFPAEEHIVDIKV
ncbi:MAG: hypothetical protein LBC21_03015 [Oscillospiraceae bacterium]|jgi:hypothetical protein|nr:hypothetical protein [Oscillospiraceae bacterium]